MAYGIKRLRQFQLGQEVTPGTPVVGTAQWRGVGTLEDARNVEEVDEDVGILGGVDEVYIPKLYGVGNIEAVEATFEQLPYLFEGGVKKQIAGVADGPGTDFIYTYPMSLTTVNTLQPFSIKAGDNNEVEEMEYGLVESITLTGDQESAMKMAATWFGRQITGGKAFESLSVPAVDVILASKGALALDADSGSFGTTPVTGTLLDWSLDIKTGVKPVFTSDNAQLYFQSHKIVEWEVMLNLTMEWDGSATTEKGNWRTKTKRLLQLLIEGPAVATAGTIYSNKTFIMNLPGVWKTFAALTDQDGNDTVKATFKSKYNVTAAVGPEFIVVNELSTLP